MWSPHAGGRGAESVFPFIELTQGEQAVLFLPGLDGSRSLVQGLARNLDSRVTLLWADFNSVRDLTYPRAVDMLQQSVERHSPCAIMAESFGSTVAISWALEHPESNLPLIFSGPLSWTRRRKCTWWGRAAALTVPRPLQPFFVRIGGRFIVGKRLPMPQRWNLIQDFMSIPRRAWLDRLTMLLEVDLRPRLAELQAPLSLIWGEEDRVVWSRLEAEVFEAAGHGEAIRILPNIAHSVLAEAPETLAEELMRVLNGNGNGRSESPGSSSQG
jgi:pimeloyl-ACP methyl ester carboxylesterase